MSEEQQLPEVKHFWLQRLDLENEAKQSLGDAIRKDPYMRGLSVGALSAKLLQRDDLAIKALTKGGVSPRVVEALIATLQQASHIRMQRHRWRHNSGGRRSSLRLSSAAGTAAAAGFGMETLAQHLVDSGFIQRITAQEFLKQPLPEMEYISQPKVSTTQAYEAYPSSVVVWELDQEAIQAAADSVDSDTSGVLFSPLEGFTSVVMSSERGVQQHLHNVLERFIAVLNSSGRSNKQQWMVQPAASLLEGVASGSDLAAAADANATDELLCSLDGRILAMLQVKLPEVLASVGTDSFADPRVVGTEDVVNTISQVTSYAAARGIRYCAVSTYLVTWLMWYDDQHVLHVTKGLPYDSRNPTVLQGLWWITTLALGGGGVSQPWTPSPSPPWLGGTKAAQSGAANADTAPSSSFAVGQQAAAAAAQAAIDLDGGSGSPRSTAAWQLTDLTDVSWLGDGMSGDVYRARLGGIMVVVKISQDADGIRRLLHEVDMYRRLQPLQGGCIPQLVAYGRSPHGRSFWIATELFTGQELDPSSDPAHRAPEVHLAARACLMSIHAAGVLHGDVRGANILVDTSSQRVHFVDLGMAQVLGPPPGPQGCGGSGSSSDGARGGASSLVERGECTSELDELDALFGLQGASWPQSAAAAAPLAALPVATSTLNSNTDRRNVRMGSVAAAGLQRSGGSSSSCPHTCAPLLRVRRAAASQRPLVAVLSQRAVVGGRFAQGGPYGQQHFRF